MSTYFERRLRSHDYRHKHVAVRVPLLWLIQNIDSSCDFGRMRDFDEWQAMFDDKCSNTGFGHLVDSMLERGHMRNGAIGFYDGEITEGHHRLCAAILLGMDYVWVSRLGSNVFRKPRSGDRAEPILCAHYSHDEYPVYVDF